jgi:hypothetical protein
VEIAMRALTPRPFRLVGAILTVLPFVTPVAALAQGTSDPTVRDSSVGYIDPAFLADVVRLRYDTSYHFDRPTRAEFFWPRGAPAGPGPARVESSVDYQDISTYLEKVVGERVSGFVELPVRFLNPEVNDNTAGLADMNAGFKFALLRQADFVATFQLRAYFPTGDADRGLGNNHYSLEPALLVYKSLTERCGVEGELRYWAPIGGTDFAGDIIRYGVGVHYDVYETCNLKVVPVVEVIGWTVLGGSESVRQPSGAALIEGAEGDTIVNMKFGCRFNIREWGSLYVGYGRPLTGDRWYENTYRVEFRLTY